MYESKDKIAALIDSDNSDFAVPYELRAGQGVGAIEAPRGILYHYLKIDEEGIIERADCVIPTGQNNANIHYDLQKLVPELAAGWGGRRADQQARPDAGAGLRSVHFLLSALIHPLG